MKTNNKELSYQEIEKVLISVIDRECEKSINAKSFKSTFDVMKMLCNGLQSNNINHCNIINIQEKFININFREFVWHILKEKFIWNTETTTNFNIYNDNHELYNVAIFKFYFDYIFKDVSEDCKKHYLDILNPDYFQKISWYEKTMIPQKTLFGLIANYYYNNQSEILFCNCDAEEDSILFNILNVAFYANLFYFFSDMNEKVFDKFFLLRDNHEQFKNFLEKLSFSNELNINDVMQVFYEYLDIPKDIYI